MVTTINKYVSLSNDELMEEAFKYAQTFVTMWGYFPHSMHWNVTKLGAPCAINRLHQVFGSYYSFKNWCYRRGLRVDNNTRKGWVIHALRGARIDPHLLNTIIGKNTFGWSDLKDLLGELGHKPSVSIG